MYGIDSLLIFAWITMLVCTGLIVFPYLARRRHLITSMNTFLVGCIPFAGSSAIACATYQQHYGSYASYDYTKFYVLFVLFMVTLLATYAFWRPQKWILGYFSREPAEAPMLPIISAVMAIAMLVFNYFVATRFYIPVVNELIAQVSPAGAIFATMFAFGSWMRNRDNPLMFAGFLAVLVVCMVFAIMSGGGRRNLLGVVMAIAVYYYWNELGFKKRSRTILAGGAFTLAVFFFMTAYNQVRHYNVNTNSDRTFENAMQVLAELPNRMLHLGETLTDERFHNRFGQDAVNCSLFVISLERQKVQTRDLKFPTHFHTLYFLVTNPIPRSLWPGWWGEKPSALGYNLPKYINPRFKVNWGPGIVGHAVYEGGFYMAIFYGILFAVMFRNFDAAIESSPNNLFLLSFTAAILPQVMMLSRGDIGIVLLNVVFVTIYFVVMRRIGYFLYGRKKVRRLVPSPGPSGVPAGRGGQARPAGLPHRSR